MPHKAPKPDPVVARECCRRRCRAPRRHLSGRTANGTVRRSEGAPGRRCADHPPDGNHQRQQERRTKTAKTTTVNNTGPTISARPSPPAACRFSPPRWRARTAFDGEGQSTQGNSLAGSLTVTVTEVQSNGNLVVQGDKTLKLNQGDEFVHVSGVVRRADIATDNTVTSDKVADAHISYSGKGVINSANSMGWLARFFNSVFAPY
jgi:flagellar L-ring protein precursor FlgH